MNQSYNRRSFLRVLGLSGVALVTTSVFKGTVAAALEACEKADAKAPASMMVKALKYVPASKVKGQNCANCIQFKPETSDKKVGHCVILQGCTVATAGWCASWSKKA